MQVGDKKKASVLGFVAVGAVGFVILQLVPKAEARPDAKSNPTPTPSGDPTATTPTGTPLTAPAGPDVPLRRDPFALGPKPQPRRSSPVLLPQSSGQTAGIPVGSATSDPLPPAFGESRIPPAQFTSSPSLQGPLSTPGPRVSAAKRASTGDKPAPDKGALPLPAETSVVPPTVTIIRLLGIVESTETVALLMVGDREVTVSVGEEIIPGIRIETISLDGITFVRKPGARLAPQTPASGQLAPGEEISL